MSEQEWPRRAPINAVDVCSTERHLCVSWQGTRACLSSAPLNGGYRQANRVLNLCVDGAETSEPPENSLQQYANSQGWHDVTVALMTAASMNSLRYRRGQYRGESMELWLTCGLANARRAGDPYDWDGERAPPAGTINTIFVTSLSFSQATMAELLILLTEAKCAVLQELAITSPVSGGIATGTGTDATVIVAGDGGVERWAGKHTRFGEQAAQLMISALRASIRH